MKFEKKKKHTTNERMIIEHNWMEFSTNDSVQIYIQKGTKKSEKQPERLNAYEKYILSAPGQQLIKRSPKHLSTKWYFQLIFPLKFSLSVDHITHTQNMKW